MQPYKCCHCLFQVLVKHAGQSFRLLALAVGTLKGVSAAELAEMDLQQMEARCGALDLLGLQVLSNNLRPGSKETIANLQDKYVGIHLQMLLCVARYITNLFSIQ